MNATQKRLALIRTRLEEAFCPTFLEVMDESDQHIGHPGHQGGGRHIAIIIASEQFKEMSRLNVHREIYALLQDMLSNEIHALRITLT